MKKISLIETMLLNEPLMISQAKLTTILTVVAQRADLDIETNDSVEIANRHTVPDRSTGGTVAVIPINGSITHKPVGLGALSGMTSYQEIESQLDEALASNDVSEIVLDINSHGGVVSGAFDLADKIYESRRQKPITALVNEAAYSAAFLLASSANEVYAPRTAGVGSVGVITAHEDLSVKNENEGRKITYIKAGDYKADGNPDEPLSESAHNHMQERVNSSYKLFVDTVARNRGLDTQIVTDTQAKTYSASDALAIGFIDHVMSINSAFETILERNNVQKSQKPSGRRISRRARAINLNQ